MASGPDHYLEAERMAAAAKSIERANQEGFTGWTRSELAALAQVHATLAVAAATAIPATQRYYGADSDADRAWVEVIGA